jgi:hypothetical protein
MGLTCRVQPLWRAWYLNRREDESNLFISQYPYKLETIMEAQTMAKASVKGLYYHYQAKCVRWWDQGCCGSGSVKICIIFGTWIRTSIRVKRWVRILMTVKSWIRIRIAVMRIRTPGWDWWLLGRGTVTRTVLCASQPPLKMWCLNIEP